LRRIGEWLLSPPFQGCRKVLWWSDVGGEHFCGSYAIQKNDEDDLKEAWKVRLRLREMMRKKNYGRSINADT